MTEKVKYVEPSTQSNHIEQFFNWFVNKYGDQAYSKMGVIDIKAWAGGDPHKDLVMIINRKREVIEIESNYFDGGHAEFNLLDIGIQFERSLRGF